VGGEDCLFKVPASNTKRDAKSLSAFTSSICRKTRPASLDWVTKV